MTPAGSDPSPLERYGHNLTLLARAGAFKPGAVSEAIISKIFETLLLWGKTNKRYNPLILDLEGTTRWPVVAEAIRRMAVGEAPDPLPTTQVIALDYEALFAIRPDEEAAFQAAAPEPPALEEDDLALLDEMEPRAALDYLCKKYFPKGLWPPLEEWVAPDVVMQRLQQIFLAVRQAEGQILLYVDHFHRLMGGGGDRASIAGFNLLKPTLARGEIQLLGACTLNQYRQWVEPNMSIFVRVQDIWLPDTWEELERLRAQRTSTKPRP